MFLVKYPERNHFVSNLQKECFQKKVLNLDFGLKLCPWAVSILSFFNEIVLPISSTQKPSEQRDFPNVEISKRQLEGRTAMSPNRNPTHQSPVIFNQHVVLGEFTPKKLCEKIPKIFDAVNSDSFSNMNPFWLCSEQLPWNP